jgi:UDP-N-acetylglucosamine:LPS N-acetylglucosamine transferase
MEKAWLISINMGYGHQRTAFALKSLAFEDKIINANDYPRMPRADRKIWERTRRFYEFISNFKRAPLVGNFAFSIFDAFQKILSFYPKRDLSKPNSQLKQTYSLIKKDWGKDLINKLKTENEKLKTNLPIISTFFIPAFMAEFFNYPGEIFCVVCDADISRTWAPLRPRESKIKYFAPTERVAERLKLYGIKPENIFLIGYPLPQNLIGTEKMEILKEDLKSRILNLDPKRKYFEKYKVLIETHLGKLPERTNRPLTILFSVGGAGAQKEIGVKILKSLAEKIKGGQIKIILSAGIREKVNKYFIESIHQLGLIRRFKPHGNIEIIFEKDIESYFRKFNLVLRKTDILWTKPSELSFYSALGIPIIIAPPIGSQEEFNMRWLLKSGFGMLQENPNYTNQWLFDWLEQGYLAEAAMQGFIEGEKLGTFNIKKIISR